MWPETSQSEAHTPRAFARYVCALITSVFVVILAGCGDGNLLSTQGTRSALKIEPQAVNFVSSQPLSMVAVAFTNTSPSDLTVVSVTASRGFSVENWRGPVRLGPKQTMNLYVRFTPPAAGMY